MTVSFVQQCAHWLAAIEAHERVYAREKEAAMRGVLRGHQQPADLGIAWEKGWRATDLRESIAIAHRNAQTYALAALLERS